MMTERNIPTIYKILLNKILQHRKLDGLVDTRKAREVLAISYKLPRNKISYILGDMKCLKFLEFINHKSIKILVDPREVEIFF